MKSSSTHQNFVMWLKGHCCVAVVKPVGGLPVDFRNNHNKKSVGVDSTFAIRSFSLWISTWVPWKLLPEKKNAAVHMPGQLWRCNIFKNGEQVWLIVIFTFMRLWICLLHHLPVDVVVNVATSLLLLLLLCACAHCARSSSFVLWNSQLCPVGSLKQLTNLWVEPGETQRRTKRRTGRQTQSARADRSR